MPLACFQCVDTLPFASKHAKGMSLRDGVIVFWGWLVVEVEGGVFVAG